MTEGTVLEELWNSTASGPVVSSFRTTVTGVDTVDGPVLVGVDVEARRHLLVPVPARQTFREEVGGRAVALRRRLLETEHSYGAYAALELVDPHLSDLFTALCVEVTDRISAAPTNAVAVLRKVIEDWRALLAGDREVLGPEALAGLFGELEILRSVVERDPGAWQTWTGPTCAAQDFHCGSSALEVKTTLSVEGRVIQIHGADQLDFPPNARLLLHWARVRPDRGTSVPELVDEILSRVDDTGGVLGLLSRAGYHHVDREIYAARRFEDVESRTYEVGPGFPRVVPASLTGDATLAGVGPIQYTVDLDAAPAEARRIDADPVELLLEPA